jgi:hypothetical protein
MIPHLGPVVVHRPLPPQDVGRLPCNARSEVADERIQVRRLHRHTVLSLQDDDLASIECAAGWTRVNVSPWGTEGSSTPCRGGSMGNTWNDSLEIEVCAPSAGRRSCTVQYIVERQLRVQGFAHPQQDAAHAWCSISGSYIIGFSASHTRSRTPFMPYDPRSASQGWKCGKKVEIQPQGLVLRAPAAGRRSCRRTPAAPASPAAAPAPWPARSAAPAA